MCIMYIFNAEDLNDNAWVDVRLTNPIENCMGRSLTLVVSSSDATLGNAVTLWTYPRYLDGQLLLANKPIEGRTLGLQFNPRLAPSQP